VSTVRDGAATHPVESTAPEAAPWLAWIAAEVPEPAGTESVVEWLQRLQDALPEHAAACREDEQRLAMLWQHMVPKLTDFLPEEVGHVVASQLEAAARRGAADALVEMVRVERDRLADAEHPMSDQDPAAVDAATLRRLLDGIATDRASTGRAAIAEALETLCSIALELELTERRLGAGSAPSDTLADLRDHVVSAASTLRSLPNHVQVRAQSDEDLTIAVQRCLNRYTGSLETELEWDGLGNGVSPESASAAIWVLQELLHHLHGTMAGRVHIVVTTTSGLLLQLTTPSNAFAIRDHEPDWLLRCRLRLQLAGGAVTEGPTEAGSAVAVQLP